MCVCVCMCVCVSQQAHSLPHHLLTSITHLSLAYSPHAAWSNKRRHHFQPTVGVLGFHVHRCKLLASRSHSKSTVYHGLIPRPVLGLIPIPPFIMFSFPSHHPLVSQVVAINPVSLLLLMQADIAGIPESTLPPNDGYSLVPTLEGKEQEQPK